MAKTLVGTVVSNRADKTIAVKVDTRKSHPIYKKNYTTSKKFLVHDEKNEANKGDVVEISEARQVSKRKSWTLNSVVTKTKEKLG